MEKRERESELILLFYVTSSGGGNKREIGRYASKRKNVEMSLRDNKKLVREEIKGSPGTLRKLFC